jgi:cytochrome c553
LVLWVLCLVFLILSCVSGISEKEIAFLETNPGYQLFQKKKCAKCHGEYGQGIFGNRKLRGLALRRSDIIAKVRGAGSKDMPVYDMRSDNPDAYVISDYDLLVLAAFIEKNWN